MPALYTHTTRADGTTLTAVIYNADHQNHIDHGIPQDHDDYSTNVAQMQSNVDPGEVGTESLPTSLAGELERLRFAVKEIKGTAQWYQTAPASLSAGIALLIAANTFTAAQHISVTGAAEALRLTYTDAGSSVGPNLLINRISSSPATNDALGFIQFNGTDSALNNVPYGDILSVIRDPTTSSHDGEIHLRSAVGGTVASQLILHDGVILSNPAGAFKGNGTLNLLELFVNGVPTGWNSYAAKTADYTVAAADNGGVVRWTTAGFSANLTAAATLGNAFRVILINDAASGDVTINPNSTETLDGFTTRLLRPGDRVELVCNGSAWFTAHGKYSFRGANTALPTAANTGTFAHALGIAPKFRHITVGLRCNSAEIGYSVGDEIIRVMENDGAGTGAQLGATATSDATNVTLYWNGATTSLHINRKDTQVLAAITIASWQYFVEAEVIY